MTMPGDASFLPQEPHPDPSPPAPIVTSPMTFDLGADPRALETAAESVRTLGRQASSARETVDTAAGQIEAEGAWEGQTADSYQSHRRKLTGNLGTVGDAADRAAGTLVDAAAILRKGQARLDEQKARLAGVARTEARVRGLPSDPSGSSLTFEPKDEAEASLVRDVCQVAGEIRADVDEQLGMQAGLFRRILNGWGPAPGRGGPPSLTDVSPTWRPRNVRVLTFNIGEGHGNQPWFWPFGDDRAEDGTDPGDIPKIGQTIAGSGANVVNLQEVFKGDADKLAQWLNEHTDGEWELHFEPADSKVHFDDGIRHPDHELHEPFGNVVLVRKGGGLGDPTQASPVQLQDPGWVRRRPEGRVLQHTEVPLDD